MKSLIHFLYTLFLLLVAASSVFSQVSGQLLSPCLTDKQLEKLHLPDVRLEKVEVKDEPVSHLTIRGIIGTEIHFELMLPKEWNGRFAMGGGGGFVGSVQNSAAYSLSRGYATVGTDTGHQGSGHRATWANNNIERQLNFGYMAIHQTAVVAREIIRRYYCEPPLYCYFLGCSRGGGQAMMEAQRYPEDFDGIVAGAPAFTWPSLGAEFIQNTKAIYPEKLNEPILSINDLILLEKLVLEQCDALDILPDGIVNNPLNCKINFGLFPICDSPGEKGCFTPDQLKAIQTVYAGVTINGKMVYPGFPFGGEGQPGGWYPWIVGQANDTVSFEKTSLEYRYGTEVLKYFVFHDSTWDFRTYDFKNFPGDSRFASSFLDATSTDYTGFRNRGGKMIIYHGWSDAALSALSTIAHYERASKQDSYIQDYIRLFLLPGVLHCGGGPGPYETDWLEHIRAWVENGIAPDQIVVSKLNEQGKKMSRPVFPYPYVATYNGEGNPGDPSSFHKNLPDP